MPAKKVTKKERPELVRERRALDDEIRMREDECKKLLSDIADRTSALKDLDRRVVEQERIVERKTKLVNELLAREIELNQKLDTLHKALLNNPE